MTGESADTTDPRSRAGLQKRAALAYLAAGRLIADELAHDLHNPVHYMRLATVYQALGKSQKARETLLTGLSICPEDEGLVRMYRLMEVTR